MEKKNQTTLTIQRDTRYTFTSDNIKVSQERRTNFSLILRYHSTTMVSEGKALLPNLRKIPTKRKHLPQSIKRYPNGTYAYFISHPSHFLLCLGELVIQFHILTDYILLTVKHHTQHRYVA